VTERDKISETKGNIGFITIGCRSNQADTASMVTRLHENFMRVDPFSESEKCNFLIVNTCTVTSRAEADARKLIRRVKRLHPEAVVVVTGCAVQVDGDRWLGIPEVDHILGILDRDRIREIFEQDRFETLSEIPKPSGGVDGPTPVEGHRSRPFLKIQDGCTRGCAYCIVPTARGPERSRSPELVTNDLKTLSDLGYREIVLTGIHLGRWGIDLGLTLRDLLEILDKLEIDARIRLSSLEPMDLTPELVKFILSIKKICPHLHIPLQSGDQNILDIMGRGHTLEQFRSLIEEAKRVNPNTAIGTDVIVGFPGENDESHQNTLNFLKSLQLSYLHIFSWSPRPGTRAETLPNRPRGEETRSRGHTLKALNSTIRRAFRDSQIGSTRDFLIETPEGQASRITALSDNYIRISVQDSVLQSHIGNVVPLIIDNKNAGIGSL